MQKYLKISLEKRVRKSRELTAIISLKKDNQNPAH